jgi:hypothetical protein
MAYRDAGVTVAGIASICEALHRMYRAGLASGGSEPSAASCPDNHPNVPCFFEARHFYQLSHKSDNGYQFVRKAEQRSKTD